MALVIGLASVAVLAVRASQEAVHQRDTAVAEQLISQSESLADANPVISKLLSIAAWRLNPSNNARHAMLAAAVRPGIAVLVDQSGPVDSVAISPDGKILAAGSTRTTELGKNAIRLWDMSTGRQISSPISSHTGGNFLTGGTGGVWSVAFSPDGKILASGSDDGTVRLWDVATGQQVVQPLSGPSVVVDSVAFNPAGKIVAGAGDKRVWLWDVATGRQIGRPLTGHTDDVQSVAFSPDGKILASGNGDGAVQLWDVATGRQFRRSFTGHTDLVDSVAFSPDGKTLASGSQDNTVRFWNVATGSQLGRPLTGSGIVDSVAFSPDGKTLASGSGGVIRLWDATNRRQIGDLPQSATSVAFSPDGKTLAAGGRDGTVQLWDVAYLVDAIPHLCALTGRSLTRAEWARYVPVGPAYQSICP